MLNAQKLNFYIIITIIIAVLSFIHGAKAIFFDAEKITLNSASTAVSVDLSPESLFQKLRDFISIEITAFSPKELFKNSFSGLNETIKDITGVDIIRFSGFVAGLFYGAFSWLTKLLQNIKSG